MKKEKLDIFDTTAWYGIMLRNLYRRLLIAGAVIVGLIVLLIILFK